MEPTKRFDDRARDHARHRPSYSRELVTRLVRELGLRPDYPIADIGSGTGISTRIFLNAGSEGFAVEPSVWMRQMAVRDLLGELWHRYGAATGHVSFDYDTVVYGGTL